jgi:hypothetical protein
MSYTINLTNGHQLTVVQDGTLDNTTSLTLAGANYVGYGQFLNENFVYLLENGANSTPPAHPLTGQIWYNTTAGALQVYTSGAFKSIPTVAQSHTAPTNGAYGDFWWDNLNYQLYVWSDGWQLVGPLYQQSMGVTGAIPTRIWDTNFPSTYHDCITLQTGTAIAAIINTGTSSFVPSPSITGYSIIRPGINLNTSYTNIFNGTATNSQLLNGLAPSAFYQLNTDLNTTGNINTTNSVNIGNAKVVLSSNLTITSDRGVVVQVPSGPAITIDPNTGLSTVPGNPVSTLGVATKGYVDTAASALQVEINSNVSSINSNITSAIASLTAQINALQTAFNSNISTINTEISTLASTSFVQNAILAAMPIGIITVWKGSSTDIPTNWHLCDGTNGTPDFRDKFVIGAGGNYAAGATGGATTVSITNDNLPSHTHPYSGSISVSGSGNTGNAGGHTHGLSDPSHSHIFPGDDQLAFAAGYAGWGGASAAGFPYDAASSHSGGGQLWYTTTSTTGITVSSVTDHNHTYSFTAGGSYSGTTGGTGNGTAISILPPYYAKCWIMKIA